MAPAKTRHALLHNAHKARHGWSGAMAGQRGRTGALALLLLLAATAGTAAAADPVSDPVGFLRESVSEPVGVGAPGGPGTLAEPNPMLRLPVSGVGARNGAIDASDLLPFTDEPAVAEDSGDAVDVPDAAAAPPAAAVDAPEAGPEAAEPQEVQLTAAEPEPPAPAPAADRRPCGAGPCPAVRPEPALQLATPPAPSALERAALGAVGLTLLGGLALAARLLAGLLTRARARPLHPRAQALLDTVRASPGLSLAAVRAACGLANGVARHHVRRLLRDGHLVAHRYRNTVRLFENHGRHAGTWRQESALRAPGNARLLAWLAAHPGASQSDAVGAALGWRWSRSLTQKRLRLLADAGLVARRGGRVVRYVAIRCPAAVQDAVPPAAALPLLAPLLHRSAKV